MNIADRIQHLRKNKGISQEELADRIGVSRQAVSKWESEQSMPDLEKIITMSEIFNVTTDYLLKGIEPVVNKNQKGNEFTSRVLYISSTAFIAIGLLCCFGGWYEEQTMEAIWGSMIIQAVGVAGYFIGSALSREKASSYICFFNIIGIAFIPISMMTGALSITLFKQGRGISPFPTEMIHALIFGIAMLIVASISITILRKRIK